MPKVQTRRQSGTRSKAGTRSTSRTRYGASSRTRTGGTSRRRKSGISLRSRNGRAKTNGRAKSSAKVSGRARTKPGQTATEIVRGSNPRPLKAAASRLKASGAPRKILQVSQNLFAKAVEVMKATRVKGTVRNIGGTTRRTV